MLPSIPAFDWGWLFRNRHVTAIAVAALTVGAIWFFHWASRHIADFKQRVGQGFAILRDRARYAREVVSWQLLSWVLRIASLYWFLRAFHVHASSTTRCSPRWSTASRRCCPSHPAARARSRACSSSCCTARPRARSCSRSASASTSRVTAFNVAIGAIAIFPDRTLRLRKILGRAKASRESEEA